VSVRLSAHLGTLWPELPPLERPAAAAAAGLRLVEAWWPVAPAAPDWIAAVRAAGLRAALVNADGGDLAAGERGFCNLPGREEEAVAAAEAAARVAVAAGGGLVNLLVGRDDGVRPLRVQRDAAAEVVRAAAAAAAAEGAGIVIEHLNPVEVAGPLLPTPAAAADFVAAVDHPGVRLLYDAYHAARAGLDPLAALEPVSPLVGHVQYADHPGRGAPGSGRIDLEALVERLEELGYAGAVGLEFLPGGRTADALAAPALRRLIRAA
jgi:hydroxypyruvate isomerase